MRTLTRLPLVLAVMIAGTLLAAPAPAAQPTLDEVVTAAMVAKTKSNILHRYRVTPQREAQGWVFGVGMWQAARREGDRPQAWIFLAHRDRAGWTVALEGGAAFGELAARAPEPVFSKAEKDIFAARDVGIMALSNNTGLRLPYAVGQTWSMGGGPHGWAGTDTPYSSLDLSGGDGIVRAAGSGTVYTMCADSSNGGTPGGWRRVYHPSGYTTDYYHLWNLTSLTPGSTVAEGTALGRIGKNICGGGSANGPHVHWGILSGTARVAWHWRSAGKWVFWNGASAYGGYALHGSTRSNVGGSLYNYGALATNQGIVDAFGGGTVNRRSGPGTGYPVVGSLTDGATVTISCWRNGTTHSGRWGATAVWNRLTDGTWFSDAFAYTGVTTIGPNC